MYQPREQLPLHPDTKHAIDNVAYWWACSMQLRKPDEGFAPGDLSTFAMRLVYPPRRCRRGHWRRMLLRSHQDFFRSVLIATLSTDRK